MRERNQVRHFSDAGSRGRAYVRLYVSVVMVLFYAGCGGSTSTGGAAAHPVDTSKTHAPQRSARPTLGDGAPTTDSEAPTTDSEAPSAHSGAHSTHSGAHSTHSGGHLHVFTNAEQWADVFDARERDAWQRPAEVLRALDLEPTMSVADVGAGTGYFTTRLARAVPHGEVIATDIEADMVRFLTERARREGLDNVRAVHSTVNASGLLPASVDRILLVNVWHHLEQRAVYARDLAAALKPGGRLLIVEFGVTARRGPPVEMRVAPETIVATLEQAGLVVNVSRITLPEQYIVEAHKPK